MAFTLRVPDSENPHLRGEAVVVSRHATLGAARIAFYRRQITAARQGYLCEAFIWDEENDCLAPDAAAGGNSDIR